jgi:hypothetical protein
MLAETRAATRQSDIAARWLSKLCHLRPSWDLDVNDLRRRCDHFGEPGHEVLEVIGLYMYLACLLRLEPLNHNELVGGLDTLEAFERQVALLLPYRIGVPLDARELFLQLRASAGCGCD